MQDDDEMSVIATSCRKPVVKFPLLWSSETWQFAFQESNQASLSGIRTQNSEFRFEKQEFRFESQNLRKSIDSWELGIGSLEVRIEQDLKLKIENSRKFHFSGKRPSVSIENEKSEYAEITPQPKE